MQHTMYPKVGLDMDMEMDVDMDVDLGLDMNMAVMDTGNRMEHDGMAWDKTTTITTMTKASTKTRHILLPSRLVSSQDRLNTAYTQPETAAAMKLRLPCYTARDLLNSIPSRHASMPSCPQTFPITIRSAASDDRITQQKRSGRTPSLDPSLDPSIRGSNSSATETPHRLT